MFCLFLPTKANFQLQNISRKDLLKTVSCPSFKNHLQEFLGYPPSVNHCFTGGNSVIDVNTAQKTTFIFGFNYEKLY